MSDKPRDGTITVGGLTADFRFVRGNQDWCLVETATGQTWAHCDTLKWDEAHIQRTQVDQHKEALALADKRITELAAENAKLRKYLEDYELEVDHVLKGGRPHIGRIAELEDTNET